MNNDDAIEKLFNHLIRVLYPEIVNPRSQLRCLMLVLLTTGIIIAIDTLAPTQISLRNLLLIPVIMVSLIERRKIIYLFIGVNAFLFANAVKQTLPETNLVAPLVNFASAFLAYSILSETILLGLNTISSLGKRLTAAHQRVLELNQRLETINGSNRDNDAGSKTSSLPPR